MPKLKVTITTEDSEVLDTFVVVSDPSDFQDTEQGRNDMARDVRQCIDNHYETED